MSMSKLTTSKLRTSKLTTDAPHQLTSVWTVTEIMLSSKCSSQQVESTSLRVIVDQPCKEWRCCLARPRAHADARELGSGSLQTQGRPLALAAFGSRRKPPRQLVGLRARARRPTNCRGGFLRLPNAARARGRPWVCREPEPSSRASA